MSGGGVADRYGLDAELASKVHPFPSAQLSATQLRSSAARHLL
jgi:hypothetical protein